MKNKNLPLKLRIMARLGELSFEERYIPRVGGRDVYGEWYPEGRVIVNVVPHCVDTIVHECLHELFPKYKERAICSLTGKIMRQFDESELKAIYAEYVRKRDESS